MAYLATLPLIRLDLFTLATKAVVAADVCFVMLVSLAALAGAWRRPSTRLLVVAALPPLATVAIAMLAKAPVQPSLMEIARTGYSMAILVALASLALSRERLRLAARAWTLTAVVVCVIGLAAFAGVVFLGVPPNELARPNSANLGPGVIRIAGVLGTNALTLYLLVSSAFAATLAASGQSLRERRSGTAALVFFGFTSLAATSRGAVGFMFAIALLAWRDDLAPLWLSRRRVAIGLAATLLLVVAVPATLWGVFPVTLQRDPEAGVSLAWNRRPNAYRVLHTAGLRMLSAHPLFGVGPGSFGMRLADFTTAEERNRAWPSIDPRLGWVPHSTWIGLAAEGGLLLLSAWSALFLWLWRALLAKGTVPNDVAPYLGLALLGLVVNGLHVDLLHLKFVWAGLALGLSGRAPQ